MKFHRLCNIWKMVEKFKIEIVKVKLKVQGQIYDA